METALLYTLKRNLLKSVGDFWTKYNCDEVLDIKIGAVDAEYRNIGLGKEMRLKTMDLAKVLGLEVGVRMFLLKFYMFLI